MKTLRAPRRANSVKPASKKAPSPAFSRTNHGDLSPSREASNFRSIFDLSVVDVSRQHLSDFSFLSESARTVNASNNDFSCFSGFPANFRVQELDVSNSPIESFRGAQEAQYLQTLKLYRCPVTKNEFYRVCCLIVFGQSLKSIDGDTVKAKERQAAYNNANLGEILKLGWMPDKMPLSKADVNRIKDQMGGEKVQIVKSHVKPLIKRRQANFDNRDVILQKVTQEENVNQQDQKQQEMKQNEVNA